MWNNHCPPSANAFECPNTSLLIYKEAIVRVPLESHKLCLIIKEDTGGERRFKHLPSVPPSAPQMKRICPFLDLSSQQGFKNQHHGQTTISPALCLLNKAFGEVEWGEQRMSGTAKDNLGPCMPLSVSSPFPLEKWFEAQIVKSVWTFERNLKNVQPVLLSCLSGYNAPLT